MVEIKATHKYPIPLGRTGENEAVRVAFTLAPFEEVFPGGTPALLVKRKGDAAAYPVTLTVEGLTAYWTVTSADTDKAGFGQCELQWHLGDTLTKSNKFDFIVDPALEAGAEPPDEPSKRWFDAIQAQIGDLSKLTTKAKDNLVAAINEAARSGGGSGGAGTIDMRVADGYIQYSNDDGATWENLIVIADLKGAPGKDGVTPDIKIGTVTTLPAGSEATASMGGTAAQPTLNLGIPKGAPGGGANVTKDAVVAALGFTPISADDVPVKSVNGQTGEAKTNWYFNVTGSVASPATTQTAAQIVAAQTAGFAPICKAVLSEFNELPATLPALLVSSMMCVFGGIGAVNGTASYISVMINGFGTLKVTTGDVASKDDIPTIPTALKNPNALNIKIGDTTTSYDGSAAKTVEIPEGGGTDESLGITGAAAGKIPKIKEVDASGKPTAWEATALPNEAFIVYFTLERKLTGDPTITSDRTPEEVIAAIASKKLVIALLKQNNEVTQLCNISNTVGNLYFFTILKDGRAVGIGWNIEADDLGEKTYTLTTMTPLSFITYSGTSGPNQIFGTGEMGGYEFKQHIGFENLPEVTTSDNDKFMRVVNGAWKAAAIDNANGGSF